MLVSFTSIAQLAAATLLVLGVSASPTKPTQTSSACSATVTPGNLLANGDFECGLTGWTVEVPDSSATRSLGYVSHTLTYALEVELNAPAQTPQQGVSARASTSVAVKKGATYEMRFWSFFNVANAGFIGVKINGAVVYTVDAQDKGYGAWHENVVIWKADAKKADLVFEFLFGKATAALDRLDTISFVKK